MAEIYINSFSPVKTKIFWAGSIQDAESDVLVDVYDITEDPTVFPAVNAEEPILFEIEANKSDVDPGSYEVYLPFETTTRVRNLKLVWKYLMRSEEQQHISFLDIVTPYVALAEAVEDLGISTDPSDPNYRSYHDLKMAEKYARKLIESHTGQQFYLYNDVRLAYGAGDDVLTLPLKINTIQKIYENDILVVDNINDINNWLYRPMVSESGFGIRVDRSSSLDNSVYTANGLVPPSINDNFYGAFKKDYRYRIAGKYGWVEVPDNIEQAAVQLMGDFFAKDNVWLNKYIKNISTFDWQFEYDAKAFSGTGNVYADSLLKSYVLTNMVII